MTNAHKYYSWIGIKLSLYTLFCISLLGFYFDSNAFSVSSAVIGPIDVNNGVYTSRDVVFTWSGQEIKLGKTTLYSSNWSINGTRTNEIIHSEKYGSLGFCRLVINTLPTQTLSGSTGLIYCPSYNNFIVQGGQLIAGPTGPAGTNGTNGMTGLSAYQLAQAGGFTGSEIEWIQSLKGEKGATGETTHEIVFSTGAIFSGSTFTLDNGDVDASLSSGSTYVPLIAKKEGKYLLDVKGVLNMIYIILITITTILLIIKLGYKKTTL